MLFALGFISMFVIGGLSGIYLGRGADRHPRLRHVLRRRAHPLRALRRLGVHDLRRDLLLVPEDDRPDVRRAAREAPLLADVRRLQRSRSSRCTGIGLQGMPRRVADYAPQFADWNLFISIASFVLGASTLVFLYNMIASWRAGRRRRANPWRAHDARVAGLLAAADLQLRRDPAGRRRPVRVRRPGRAARGLQRRPRAASSRRCARSELDERTSSWSRTRRSPAER